MSESRLEEKLDILFHLFGCHEIQYIDKAYDNIHHNFLQTNQMRYIHIHRTGSCQRYVFSPMSISFPLRTVV